MNHIHLPKLFYIILLPAFAACRAQAMPLRLTVVPPTEMPPSAVPPTQAPTAKPLGEHVVAEWKMSIPEDIVFGFGSVWVPSHRSPNITTRIDPVSNKVIAVI